jgi:alanyl-tRNA synthetase
LKANEWIGEVSTLLDGKGGGRGEAAQLTGNNPGAVAEAMQKATAFAQSKLGLADLASSTAKLGFV